MPKLGTYGSVRGVPGNRHPYRDRGQYWHRCARNDIAQYIAGFNVQRPHSSLADATPDEFYFANLPAMGKAA